MENGKSRLQQVQDDAEQVKDIMLENLQKVEDRTGKLGELEDRADQLLVQSKAFQKTTAAVKQKTCLQAMKMKLLLGGLVLVFVLVIIVVIIIFAVPSQSKTNDTTNNPNGR